MTAAELLGRLKGVRKVRTGEWTARCPAHDDRNPSLSVSEGEKRLLLHCHAGCEQGAVVGALGIEFRHLFHENGNGTTIEIVATYDYLDEDGAVLFQVVRLFPKKFFQRRPDGNGGWIWKLEDTRRVLYNLPQLIEAVASEKLIHVVEGEKDVHAVEKAGGVATTLPGGALKEGHPDGFRLL